MVHVLDDEGEGDRHHGEIGPRYADGRQGQQRADGAGKDAGDDEREPEVDAVQCEDGDRVGADRIEADVADGDLPGETEQAR